MEGILHSPLQQRYARNLHNNVWMGSGVLAITCIGMGILSSYESTVVAAIPITILLNYAWCAYVSWKFPE